MRLATFITCLAALGPVAAYAQQAGPDIAALIATETTDGTVQIAGNGGFFAVATSNIGAAGTVMILPELGDQTGNIRITVCETNTATGACLAAPQTLLVTHFDAGDQRSFAVFLRKLDPTRPLREAAVTLAFEADDGRRIGSATATIVRDPETTGFQVPWLMWLFAGSLAYAVILGINRIVFRAPRPR